MENFNGSSNLRNLSCLRRQFPVPPGSPILCNVPPNAEHISGSSAEITQGFPTPNEVQADYHHQRTSSDSFLLEEQPSWFEELLNEPVKAPVASNHRRSLSDSFTFLDATPNIASKQHVFVFKDKSTTPSGPPSNIASKELNYREIMSSCALFHTNPMSSIEKEFRESSSTASSTFSIFGLPISTEDGMTHLHTSQASCSPNKSNSMTTHQEEPFKPSGSDYRDCSHANPPAQNKSSKRSKQYVVRLLAKGSQASAELEFLDQHYLILGMENRALKYQLDCLMHEQFIKCLEQDMLEREVARLRNLYHQQQQQSTHRR
ncbi:hypothetical protein FNV43_RR10623 [Rhamnella rubrinervis]|uniref:Uncharacterized protein n=1 Tax=Rhamnella rubrinervis TaxID=2594499 RepID=A0A8K0MGZ9_9ROSA|nr:hypothetical protein FNV43_RR10623 [Rhamnella rubrinervis]